MFRQKRKQRHELSVYVDELTDGMTVRNLTEHYRFWCIMNKWGGPSKRQCCFLNAVEKKLSKVSQKRNCC